MTCLFFSKWFLGSRKFIIMLLCILLGGTFRIFDLLSGRELVDLLQAMGVAFMGSNVAEHMLATAKNWVAAKYGNKGEE